MDDRVRGVLLVDDHRSFGEALAIAIGLEDDMHCVGIATSSAEALELAMRCPPPDVAVVDVHLPDGSGLSLAARLREIHPGLPVLAVTAHTEAAAVVAAAEAGVCGFLRKECRITEIVAAIRGAEDRGLTLDASTLAVLTRRQPDRSAASTVTSPDGLHLTPREIEVLELLSQALDAQGIARRLGISIHTTRGYVKSLLAKFDVHTQLELVVRAREHAFTSASTHELHRRVPVGIGMQPVLP